jgi:hypothetical protein
MSGLENHHIAGKCNSELTITLGSFDPFPCGCHPHINTRQWCWDSRWVKEDNSENLRASFIIQGVQELLIELHFKTGISDYRIMADALSPSIRSYRERG